MFYLKSVTLHTFRGVCQIIAIWQTPLNVNSQMIDESLRICDFKTYILLLHILIQVLTYITTEVAIFVLYMRNV